MNAALYARVSTEDQATEGHSIDAQLRLMRDYCARKGYAVAAEYIEPGKSARSTARPTFTPRPHPTNAAGLRMAFDLCAQGMTPLQIAQALNDAGYRTSGNRGVNPFGVDTVLPMLKNRFALGEISFKGEWRDGAHAAIIDREQWDT